MSFNIGNMNSKFITVRNITMKFALSEKVLFATLHTSRKTENIKMDRETGEVITNEKGEPIFERIYSNWEGRFVGNAFEPAKGLKNGEAINILNGWIDKEEKIGKNGQKYTNIFAIITDFELSNPLEEDVDPTTYDDTNY